MKSDKLYSKILIKNINGQHWEFYVLDNKLFYIVSNENTYMEKQAKLIDNINTYDIAIDTHNNIHLVYSCYGGEFCYMRYSDEVWSKNTFYKADEKVEIDFINILTTNDSVHIFYTYRNDRKYYRIFHIYESTDQWTYTQVAKVPLWKVSIPYRVDSNVNNDIIMLFMARFQGYNKVYFKIFNSQNSIWSISKGLKLDKGNAVIKDFLIDSRDNHHLIYHDNTHVCYVNYHLGNANPTFNSPPNDLKHLENGLFADYQIFECDDKIFASCNDGHSLYCFTSDDFGKTWGEKIEYDLNDMYPTKLIYIRRDFQITKPIITMGSMTNEIKDLLGMTDYPPQKQSDKIITREIDKSPPPQDTNIIDDEEISMNDNEEEITNPPGNLLYESDDKVPIETDDYNEESIIKKLKKFFSVL